MANPRGQQRDKPFRDALRLEISAAQAGEGRRSLRSIARQLLDQAVGGDITAIKEVADRIDGKVPQAVVGDDEHDPVRMVARLERLIVDPANPDSPSISAPIGTEPI